MFSYFFSDKNQIFRLISLFLFAGITSFYYYIVQEDDNLFPVNAKEKIEGVMNSIVIQEYDTKGQLLTKLLAQKAYQFGIYNEKPALVFDKPYIDVYTPDQKHWGLVADWGKFEKNRLSSNIYLKGGVQATQNEINGKGYTQMNTQELEINPKNKWIKTNAAVEIQQNLQRISAKGFMADLNSGKINLYSNVHVSFEGAF